MLALLFLLREGQNRPSLSIVAKRRDLGFCFEKIALYLLMWSGVENECAQDEHNNSIDVEIMARFDIMKFKKRYDRKYCEGKKNNHGSSYCVLFLFFTERL